MTKLDPDDPRPPYLQLVGSLRTAVRAGDYQPGDQLPTYQELADEYGVAVNTVKSALGVLRDEGLVVIRHGKGSFVRTQLGRPDDPHAGADVREIERLWHALAEMNRRVAILERRSEDR
jgi:DNA-binding GntR family transcriptional regulator